MSRGWCELIAIYFSFLFVPKFKNVFASSLDFIELFFCQLFIVAFHSNKAARDYNGFEGQKIWNEQNLLMGIDCSQLTGSLKEFTSIWFRQIQ